MFDVEKLIEQWRAGLTDSEVISRADIQEMEGHLREEIAHLETASLSSDEAFLVARHRLGDPTALEREFAKVRPHRGLLHRLCWAIAGVLLYLAVTEFSRATFYLFLTLGRMAGLQPTALGVCGSVVELAGFAGPVVLALWLYLRHFYGCADRRIGHSRVRPILGAAVLVLGIWVFLVTGRLLTYLFVETAGVATFSAALQAEGYVREAWHLLMPVLLAGLLLVLHLRSRREVQAQQ